MTIHLAQRSDYSKVRGLHTSTHEQHLISNNWHDLDHEKPISKKNYKKKTKGWRGSSLYQVFVPRFPKGGDVKAKRLQGVFVIQVLL